MGWGGFQAAAGSSPTGGVSQRGGGGGEEGAAWVLPITEERAEVLSGKVLWILRVQGDEHSRAGQRARGGSANPPAPPRRAIITKIKLSHHKSLLCSEPFEFSFNSPVPGPWVLREAIYN